MNKLSECANQILSRCDSTNTVAKHLADRGYPHGTWVSTRVQEAGRGRLGRRWESMEGNLFLSILFRIEEKSLWTWVPLASAVGTVRCLRELFPELEVKIKWPNDIWFKGAKLGGILCEGSASFIVMGIGLNCATSPEGLDQPVVNLTAARNGVWTTADDVRKPILNSILNEVDYLMSLGPERLKTLYRSLAVFSQDTEVEWQSNQSSELQKGVVQDIGPLGELLVINSNGYLISLFAEDVKLRCKGQ